MNFAKRLVEALTRPDAVALIRQYGADWDNLRSRAAISNPDDTNDQLVFMTDEVVSRIMVEWDLKIKVLLRGWWPKGFRKVNRKALS